MIRFVLLAMLAFLLTACQVVFIPVPIDTQRAKTVVTEVTQGVTVDTAASYLPKLSDMPVGFVIKNEGSSGTNADVVAGMKDPLAAQQQLDELGRQGGYYRFFAPTAFQVIGNGALEFTLVVFATPEQADRAIDFYVERDRSRYSTMTEFSAPALGDRSVAYLAEWENPGKDGAAATAVDGYLYTIRKGNTILFAEARAVSNTADVNQLVNMAKQVVDRLP